MIDYATPRADHAVSPRWQAAIAVLALIAVTLATYGRVCQNQFTWWDDNTTIHHNPRLNPPSGKEI